MGDIRNREERVWCLRHGPAWREGCDECHDCMSLTIDPTQVDLWVRGDRYADEDTKYRSWPDSAPHPDPHRTPATHNE